MLTGERGSTKQFVERTVWHPCYAVNILRKGGHKGEGNMGGGLEILGEGGKEYGKCHPITAISSAEGGDHAADKQERYISLKHEAWSK